MKRLTLAQINERLTVPVGAVYASTGKRVHSEGYMDLTGAIMAITRKQFAKEFAAGLTKLCRDVEAACRDAGDKSVLKIPFLGGLLVFGNKKKRVGKATN